ncbi:hypothetical protein [Candidatus Thiosymbion oneisti]|uniref:hypothetical protein n=1 Tax=Candidatus Thiosymbion oneisti TaxID=589554 RepID=UPI00105CDA2D|nr:hypothetical protein [Candidatus Thiosymbion oneisti]
MLLIEDEVADATPVWRFREHLKALELLERVFNRFDDLLAAEGFEARQGQIIDAAIVPVPIQPNPGMAHVYVLFSASVRQYFINYSSSALKN